MKLTVIKESRAHAAEVVLQTDAGRKPIRFELDNQKLAMLRQLLDTAQRLDSVHLQLEL